MAKKMRWSSAERELLEQWFSNKWTMMTLYQRLHKINGQRTYESMTRELRRMRERGFSREHEDAERKLRVGYLDIECTHLKGNFGYILCWYIKAAGRNKFYKSVITKEEILNHEFDRRVVRELLEAMQGFDLLWTHYGSDWRFDLPYIRTRAYAHGLEDMLPAKGEKFIQDTFPIARKKLALHSNRLDSIADHFGIKNVQKTKLAPEKWRLAAVGDEDSLAYIDKHNKYDVIILERVHKAMERGNLVHPIYRSM